MGGENEIRSMNWKWFVLIWSFGLASFACESASENSGESQPVMGAEADAVFSAELKELTDADYPDNPDISIRSDLDGSFSHSEIIFWPLENGHYDVFLPPNNPASDTLVLTDLDLVEWMPAVPERVRTDSFLTFVCLQNAEFNRQQVRLGPSNFELRGAGNEKNEYVRVDLARNCLNAGLWEVIGYVEENEQQKPAYHSWFDFPVSLYEELFYRRNGDLDFAYYYPIMRDWQDAPSKPVNLALLREVTNESPIDFVSRNDQYYPLVGERKKKNPNIVRPAPGDIHQISDFLNDSTQFSTFSPPGFYETKAPKSTKLSRFAELTSVTFRETNSLTEPAQATLELELGFEGNGKSTHFVVGGLFRDKIPSLDMGEMQKGFQMPMGIANHSFYESYETALANPPADNPYFGLLMDGEGKFLDSHTIGIDGPLLHWDAERPNVLHFWILSFERHAFVGHFELNLPGPEA